ncbi:MAG: hypothetical protein PHD21_04410 [Flavobacteriales bacterium]|nr:hypothetical protein [Flavobacteriales bacterium]
MKKTIKSISVMMALLSFVMVFSGCSKKNLINTYDKTYAVYTSGSEDFYKAGGTFESMVAQGKTKLYINPDVYLVTGQAAPTKSDNETAILEAIRTAMTNYGYTIVPFEDEADLVIKATNFKLWYSGIIWSPGTYIDPYYEFWGGYYPWMPVYYISVGTNKLLVELVEATSLRKFRDWYQNTWKPANPGKYPTIGNVPSEYKPIVTWTGNITGELEDKKTNDDTRLLNRVPSLFSQSLYLDTDLYL